MRNCCLLVVMALAVIACHSGEADKGILMRDSSWISMNPDTSKLKKDSHYFWAAELEPGTGLAMKKLRPLPDDSLTADNIINMLNNLYPDIPLRFNVISNDTIFLRIYRSAYLTQKTGSSGAQAYLAEVTFNLTELNNIHYVDIRFKAGDHASPDTYCRTDFVKLME